jgi:hypothetical protein
MAPPKLTDEQRAAALVKAGETRRARAETKELLKMGAITFPELLERAKNEDIVAGMKTASVLSSLPGIGKVKANRLMESCGIASNRRLRGLGERQTESLLEALS